MKKDWYFYVLCCLFGALVGTIMRYFELVPVWLDTAFLICGILLIGGYVFFGLMSLAYRGEETEWEKRRREDWEEVERHYERRKREARDAWRAQGGRFRGTKWK